MTTYKHLSAAIKAAETQLDTATEPLAVMEWHEGARFYEVKLLRKAEKFSAMHPLKAKVVVRFYPGAMDFGGES